MASKPASHTFTFSTDASFSSGPAAGNPTKVAPAGWPSNLQGFIPGLEYASEFRNYLLNKLGDWTGWLDAGSSSFSTTSNLVETDGSGAAQITNLRHGGNQHTTSDPTEDLTADIRSYKSVDLTADSTFTLRHTGTVPRKGERIRHTVKSTDGSTTVDWIREDMTNLAQMTSAAGPCWVEFEFDGTAWFLSAWIGNGEITPGLVV